MKKKLTGYLVYNGLIAASNIVLFASGFFSALAVPAVGIGACLLADAVLVIGGNAAMSKNSRELPVLEPLPEKRDVYADIAEYGRRISAFGGKEPFAAETASASEQCRAFTAKTEDVKGLLSQSFSPNDLAYIKYLKTLEKIADIFCGNVKSMANRLSVFSFEEYNRCMLNMKKGLSTDTDNQRMAIFDEHIAAVKEAAECNDAVLISLDRLLLELTKLDDLTEEALSNLPAVKEMNDLIEQTKNYR
ncbi:MAG: hypothetical protein ACI4JJ_05785 [Huintestinicola sp.]